jgi:putative flippase GtrA
VIAAVANLIALNTVYNLHTGALGGIWRYLLAQAVATELAALICFVGNDRITFRSFAGQARPWWIRCIRFHSATLLGICITFALSTTLHFGFRIGVVVAQAIAIATVYVMNFTIHHVWTYGRVKVRR